ncbi:MAG: hypothetical protein WC742_12945 [Gallionellaceae bacterium]
MTKLFVPTFDSLIVAIDCVNSIFKNIWRKINLSQKFYLLGSIFALLTCVLYIFTLSRYMFLSITVISISFLFFGVLSDLFLLYKRIWSTIIGKTILIFLVSLITNIAYAISSRIVNELVKFDTSNLTYTVNLVVFLISPILVVICLLIILSVMVIFNQIHFFYYVKVKDNKYFEEFLSISRENYPLVTSCTRFIACFICIVSIGKLSIERMPAYTKNIENIAAKFIYEIDSSQYSRCVAPAHASVIKVNESEIIVVYKDGDIIKFDPSKCTPLIKQ